MRNSSKVVSEFKLPPDGALTENERAWIEFLRIASRNSDPRLSLPKVQALRLMFDPDDCPVEHPGGEEWPAAQRPAGPSIEC